MNKGIGGLSELKVKDKKHLNVISNSGPKQKMYWLTYTYASLISSNPLSIELHIPKS